MAMMTEAALLDALKLAMQRSESGDGLTLRELRLALGNGKGMLPEIAVRESLRTLLRNGKAEAVRIYRAAMDGTMRNVSGYRLIQKKRK